MSEFKLISEYKPTGDQPKAIEKLVEGVVRGDRGQTLMGVTGSGKTFTMANVIQQVQKPTLVLAHNKTLAGQLCAEFKEFFPDNAVEYFVSYYDYYQPEAYVVHSDTYIEKDSSINDDIDELRHSATAALFERRDVIIVASVSCIYGLGDPEDYKNLMLTMRKGMQMEREQLLHRLVDIQYDRNDINFIRSTFRVRGDVVDIYPAGYNQRAIRVEFFGDEIERITEIDPLTGHILSEKLYISIFPASHYVTTPEKLRGSISSIEDELETQVKLFKEEDKLIEAQRIMQRTNYDIEMMKEVGYCNGIENYSRHVSGRSAGSAPYTLLDFFPDDYLLFIDESHVTLPQVRGMFAGDRARKENLVNYGFRLPSAFDNRPLNFTEFEERVNQVIFVSATPSAYEFSHSVQVAEQIIRPTGLLDPDIIVKPAKGQIDHLLGEIKEIISRGERVLVTTLTKKMSEDLSSYLKDCEVKAKYMHSEIDTIERMQIIRSLRMGEFDVLVGINLLREGLDIPEVSLVAILDADKEGFLRSETSLIQTIGRAARNSNSKVIMYGDQVTASMAKAIQETNRRRNIQERYNEEHGIIPTTIKKSIRNVIEATKVADDTVAYEFKRERSNLSRAEVLHIVSGLEKEMKQSARELDFERAAQLRDEIKDYMQYI